MIRKTSRIASAFVAVLLTVLMAGPAVAATAAIKVVDADLQPGRSSVQLTVKVACQAPADATSYLSTTIWQGNALHPEQPRYLEGQGQLQIVCDGKRHAYSFTATTTVFYADKHFRPGRAMTESGVQNCVFDPEGNGTCTPVLPLIRQKTRIHR